MRRFVLGSMLVLSIGCVDEPPPFRDMVVRIPPPVGVSSLPLGAAGRPILYLDRCKGGCTITPAPSDDPRQNRSVIPTRPAVLPEFPAGDAVWDDTVRCVQRIFAPFDIEVTDQDPGPVRYVKTIVAGRAIDLGLTAGLGGVAPSACVVLDDAVTFAFGGSLGRDPEQICRVIAHEAGHAYGLEHAMQCDDPMTYLPGCRTLAFQRVDQPCGEFEEWPCVCGVPFQSSYLHLLDAFGPRTEPVRYPPKVRVVEPELNATVRPRFRVLVEASGDAPIARVSLFIAGRSLVTSTVSPHLFLAPGDLEIGEVSLEARVVDVEGRESAARSSVELIAGRPREPQLPSGPIEEPAEDPSAEAMGALGAASDDKAGAKGSAPACRCTETREHDSESWAFALVLLAGVFARRRARARDVRRALLVCAVVLAACAEDGSTLTSIRGRLVLEPPPGSRLASADLVLGRANVEQLAPLVISAENTGNGAVHFGRPRIEGPGAGAFILTGWPKTLEATERGTITVRMTSEAGARTPGATLIIESDDPALPEATYPLAPSIREPCRLALAPRRQRLKVGETGSITVTAAGTSACKLLRAKLDPELFAIESPPSFPVDLAPGGSITLAVRHSARTDRPGRPVRDLEIFESEGTTAKASLEGAPPTWDCAGVFPKKIDFGTVDRGFVSKTRVLVTNSCEDEEVTVISAAIGEGEPAYRLSASALPLTVPPLGQAAIELEYDPDRADGDEGRLVLTTRDAANRRLGVRMSGRARVPRATAVAGVDFGDVVLRGAHDAPVSECSSPIRRIPIFNTGEGRLLVTGVELAPGGDPGFELEGAEVSGAAVGPGQPFGVPAGGVAFARVRFRPTGTGAGDRRAALDVHHRGLEPTLRVSLTARAVADGPVVERSILPAAAKTDLLLVVDDSRSMAHPIAQLAAITGPRLVEYADRMSADWRMAVITADPEIGAGWPRGCRPGAPIVDRFRADRGRALDCALSIDPVGRTMLGGLGASLRYLERALGMAEPSSTVEPAFALLRPDADLAVVIASDEEDLSRETDELLLAFLRSARGLSRPDRVKVYAIAGPPGGSCDRGRWVQAGLRYARAAEATGGSFHDVCTEDAGDWEALTDRLAEQIFAPPDRVALGQAASPRSILVRAGGADVPADPATGYSYDAASNTIRLNGASLPPAGTEIEVEYVTRCQPE